MKTLKVKFKSDINRVTEEIANRANAEAVTTQERFGDLHAARKLFLKFVFDSSLISKHSHCYPFHQQKRHTAVFVYVTSMSS